MITKYIITYTIILDIGKSTIISNNHSTNDSNWRDLHWQIIPYCHYTSKQHHKQTLNNNNNIIDNII
jgi:hypothetical protein